MSRKPKKTAFDAKVPRKVAIRRGTFRGNKYPKDGTKNTGRALFPKGQEEEGS